MNAEENIILVTGSNGRIGDAVRRLTGRFSDVVSFASHGQSDTTNRG
jgi:dTDP-4-dehydrorhamnose reductase